MDHVRVLGKLKAPSGVRCSALRRFLPFCVIRKQERYVRRTQEAARLVTFRVVHSTLVSTLPPSFVSETASGRSCLRPSTSSAFRQSHPVNSVSPAQVSEALSKPTSSCLVPSRGTSNQRCDC